MIISHLSIEILTSLPVVIRFWPFCPDYSLLFQPKPRLMDHLEAANTALPFPRDLRPDFSAVTAPKSSPGAGPGHLGRGGGRGADGSQSSHSATATAIIGKWEGLIGHLTQCWHHRPRAGAGEREERSTLELQDPLSSPGMLICPGCIPALDIQSSPRDARIGWGIEERGTSWKLTEIKTLPNLVVFIYFVSFYSGFLGVFLWFSYSQKNRFGEISAFLTVLQTQMWQHQLSPCKQAESQGHQTGLGQSEIPSKLLPFVPLPISQGEAITADTGNPWKL